MVSTSELTSTLEQCKQGGFDLFVLEHFVPDEDKHRMVQAFRTTCPGPIISLRRTTGEQKVDGAEYHIEADPEPLLKLVADIVRKKSAAHQ